MKVFFVISKSFVMYRWYSMIGLAFIFFIGKTGFSQEPKLVLPIGHSSSVYSVAFSPDGKWVATVGHDQIVRIWDGTDGKLLYSLQGHEDFISSVSFSNDGKKVISISAQDRAIKIWNVADGSLIRTLIDNKGWGRFVAYSAEDQKIISASMGGVTLWNAENGKPIFDCTEEKKGEYEFAFMTPDQKRLIAFSRGNNRFEGLVFVWDLSKNKLLFRIAGDIPYKSASCMSSSGDEIAVSDKGVIKIYNLNTGMFMASLNEVQPGSSRPPVIYNKNDAEYTGNGYLREVVEPVYSPDKRMIAASTLYFEYSTLLWDRSSLEPISVFTEITGGNPKFSKDGKKLMTVATDRKKIYIWDPATKKKITEISFAKPYEKYEFSPDGKKVLVAYEDGKLVMADAEKGNILFSMGGHTNFYIDKCYFSADDKKLVTEGNGLKKIWDINTGALLFNVSSTSVDSIVRNTLYGDGKRAAIITENTVQVWDNRKNILLQTISGKSIRKTKRVRSVTEKNDLYDFSEPEIFFEALVSPSGKYVLTRSDDTTARVWDIETGHYSFELVGHTRKLVRIAYSEDGKYILTTSNDYTARVWNAETGKEIVVLKGHNYYVINAEFNSATKNVITTSADFKMKVWSLETGKLLYTIEFNRLDNVLTKGQKLLTFYNETTKVLSDTPDSLLLVNLKGFKGEEGLGHATIQITRDGRKLALAEWEESYAVNKRAIIYDIVNNKIEHILTGHSLLANNIIYTPDEKHVITTSYDHTLKRWDASTGELLYTFFSVDSLDYLVVDKDNRYDGTEAARRTLYFACNTEIIELDQIKEQLWIPGLAERIINSEKINAESLSDIGICGLTPLVEQFDDTNKAYYRFKITPRRGGLGETVLLINGIEARKYKPANLLKKGSYYELSLSKNQLIKFFKTGEKNKVTLKSYTAENNISSRGVIISDGEESKIRIPPHLYAVMIGVSDYKGDELDLRFAAKDATDISRAIKSSATKLLGNDKVHIYNLTTEKERYSLPEKKAIQQTLAEIGTKATANDILLIFFAGHGVMDKKSKQFYFLTADASKASAADAITKVGISTKELTDWIQPANIRAQKRILILDACNSGQAIKDFAKFGNTDQGYTAARNDEKAGQIKAIDELNGKSGLFILSASASNQSAYELGRFSQGLLTYSLLKAIKQQSDILEDNRYLNVSRWFNVAQKTVSELAKETGARQDPQIISNSNFNIGMVDEEVRAAIILPGEKPLFAATRLINKDESVLSDDLGLGSLIDNDLNDFSSRGTDATIAFMPNTSSHDAYSVNGIYEVKENEIKCRINLRQNKETKDSFEIIGTQAELNKMSRVIAQRATDWVKNNK